jgi:hypothetical protein
VNAIDKEEPALVADLGYDASWRYVEFFTANIRNPHTRRAYARACARFFAWCEQRGLTLAAIRPCAREYLNICSTSRRVGIPPLKISQRRHWERCVVGSQSSSSGVAAPLYRDGVTPRSGHRTAQCCSVPDGNDY